MREELARLQTLRLKAADIPAAWTERVLGVAAGAPGSSRDCSALELLRRPEVSYADLVELTGAPAAGRCR